MESSICENVSSVSEEKITFRWTLRGFPYYYSKDEAFKFSSPVFSHQRGFVQTGWKMAVCHVKDDPNIQLRLERVWVGDNDLVFSENYRVKQISVHGRSHEVGRGGKAFCECGEYDETDISLSTSQEFTQSGDLIIACDIVLWTCE